jgi:quercetin dioxygenase-like cupin family protein
MPERTFRNPRTGETITFLQTARETNGELFQMSYTMAPHAAIADEHCHPHQEMRIEVTAGVLSCRVNGVEHAVHAGESTIIPAGAWHFQSNETEELVHAIEEYRPALQMEQFFQVLIGWANDGKTNETGMPSLLRAAVLHRYFKASIRSRSQTRNVVSWLLAPVGAIVGHRRELLRYIDCRD